jgi:tetratricopeptide (TPR) repeat protein
VVAGLEGISRQLPQRFLPPAIALMTAAIALLGWQTHSYATLFADHEQLWRANLQQTPDLWFARYNYAEALAERNHNEEAIVQLKESLRLNPASEMEYLSLGADLCQVGRYPEAIEALNNCLRINPRIGAAHTFLGIAHLKMGESAEAIEEFGLLLRITPDYVEGHLGMGQALVQAHRIPEAIAEFEIAQRLDPTNEAIKQQLEALKQSQNPAENK